MTPRARTVCGLVAGVGLLAVVVLLVKPVHAGFEDDPILRLQAFDRPVGALPTEVDCGSALSAVRSSTGPASLYTIARDEACHDEGYRRLMVAVAAGSVVVVLTLLLLVGARAMDTGPATPRQRRRYQPTQAAWAKESPPAGAAAQDGAEDSSDAAETDGEEDGADAVGADDLTPAEEAR